ncbi:MAG: fibronectin type III domain-containing protein, partial [Deltaproteobacteria bacterium]|nr:fibronectin type III domain-containing protein [Deltaproteobacteria bacterium]
MNSTLLAFWGVLICTAISYAAQVTLEWDANSEPNISGYNVYYGKASRDYDVTLDVGNWTGVTIADLEESEAYYFAVTAYNTDGDE